jgi:hypothetical protein
MSDAVQKFVRPRIDMVIDEMRRAAIDQERRKAQQNQDKSGEEQHGLWLLWLWPQVKRKA